MKLMVLNVYQLMSIKLIEFKYYHNFKVTTPDFASLKSGASMELEVGCKVRVDVSEVG